MHCRERPPKLTIAAASSVTPRARARTTRHRTEVGVAIGTPGYMPLEAGLVPFTCRRLATLADPLDQGEAAAGEAHARTRVRAAWSTACSTSRYVRPSTTASISWSAIG